MKLKNLIRRLLIKIMKGKYVDLLKLKRWEHKGFQPFF